MTSQAAGKGIFRAAFELFGIVLVRFRLLPKVWATWLIAVNSASLMFMQHIEAQVTLAAVGVAVVFQALIYQRKGFIRILGVTHALWIPMLTWIALRFDTVPVEETAFRAWLLTLIATNAVSLLIDASDATRFILGERRPHYVW